MSLRIFQSLLIYKKNVKLKITKKKLKNPYGNQYSPRYKKLSFHSQHIPDLFTLNRPPISGKVPVFPVDWRDDRLSVW